GLGLVDRKPESVGRNRDASGKDSVQLQAARFQDDVLVLRLVADGDPLGGTGAPESGMNEISAGREPEHARAALGLGDERQPAVLAGLGAEDAPDEAARNILGPYRKLGRQRDFPGTPESELLARRRRGKARQIGQPQLVQN